MNGRTRLTALAPLAVSSLALGSVLFTGGSAQAVAPSASCHVTQDANAPTFSVIGQGFTPGANVKIQQGTAALTMRAGADGGFQGTLTVEAKGGPVTMQEEGGPKLSCGTVQQGEQQEAQSQYQKGYLDGFTAAKATCKAEPKQGVTALDPNYEKGFNAGAAAAIAKYC